MNNTRRTIWICVVALLLIVAMLAAVWAAYQSRQQDWWEGLSDPVADPTDELTPATTDEVSVGVDGLLPGDNTDTTQKAETTTARGTTAGTTATTSGTTTRKTVVTAATSRAVLDDEGWSQIFPNLGE